MLLINKETKDIKNLEPNVANSLLADKNSGWKKYFVKAKKETK